MSMITKYPLEYYSDNWNFLPQEMILNNKSNSNNSTSGMILIPATDEFQFVVQGVEIEGDPLPYGVDFQYPWEDHPWRYHNQTLNIDAFYIDKYEVTNEEYENFLNDSGYWPDDSYNFLKDWVDGTFPPGWNNKPVTWVSLHDARAYASWAGKRLPNEWEWQYAAQGLTGNTYPWGDDWNANNVPTVDTGRTLAGPDDVDAHSPEGDSPFGVSDMVGNVWQWTNEFVDEHTRAASLRGSSYYYPQVPYGTNWYFPQAYELYKHGKYLLIDASYDRAGTIGFRCVMDVTN